MFDKKWEGIGYDEKGNIIYQLKSGYGKVKEYRFNGSLKYDGEYINGKLYNIVKEYYEEGKLVFEGEFKEGKRNGKGKEYNKEGILIFEGEYLNDKRKEE